ncbi:MAG TPA: mycothione reductase [Acidimicrobiales bacterium]
MTAAVPHHDLLIIGTGSGNTILGPEHDRLDVAIVERDQFGGTCLTRGCIPSKMYVYAADLAELARSGPRLGVETSANGADWKAIRDRIFDRVDAISEAGEAYRESLDNVTVYRGDARMVGDRTIVVNDERVSADQVVLAAGARPYIPDIPGLDSVPYHTSDTIMRIDELPEHLLVIGAGYIAAELAHVFGSLGSHVTILARGDTMLRAEDDDIRVRFTETYRRRFDVLCSTQVLAARDVSGPGGNRIELDVSVDGERRTVQGDMLLVATGRVPNGDELEVAAGGVELDVHGFVVTDEFLRTTAAGVWALGDICNPAMLKHAANADARVVAHNIVHPDDLRAVDRRFIPHAVFGFPQVASVGPTERELRRSGTPIRVSVRPYSETAYGWAMEDTDGLCKVIAHAETRQLLAAHIVGAQASILLQQLVQGMRFGLTVDQMAREQYYIHPALSEVVEQALLGL